MVESASSGGELVVAEDPAVEESWRCRWQSGGGGGELAAVVESWQWWMVGDPLHTFCLVQFQRRQSQTDRLSFLPLLL